jgi:hypothetical protein
MMRSGIVLERILDFLTTIRSPRSAACGNTLCAISYYRYGDAGE